MAQKTFSKEASRNTSSSGGGGFRGGGGGGKRRKGGGGGGPGGGKKKRPRAVKLDAEAKVEMKRLMEVECLRKPMARRIAAGEMSFAEFKMRYPAEFARSYRAKNLLQQNPEMTRARAFWLAEDSKRIEAMREKQIRTFATHTGLSMELSKAIATGEKSLGSLAGEDNRWAFIWDRAKGRIKAAAGNGIKLSPMQAIRWARGDFGLPFGADEDPDAIEAKGQELHDKYPFMKKRHTRRMARFELDLDGLAKVAPANCGWGPRALEIWERFPGHHRKFVRLMGMMDLGDEDVAEFIEKTAPARDRYRDLAQSERHYHFRLYDGKFDAQFVHDDNPFSWRLKEARPDERTKQSKLQVLFFCPAEANGAVYGLAAKDDEVAERTLDAAHDATDRLDQQVIIEAVERAQEAERELRITLRNGTIFEGVPTWSSPFEVQLRLKNNAWVMILFHGIYHIEATG